MANVTDEERDNRIAELESQLKCAMGQSVFAGDMCMKHVKRIAELEQQLAAAKPVLSADDECVVKHARDSEHATNIGWCKATMRELAAIIDRICPPPKAPPTDLELADMLNKAVGDGREDQTIIDNVEAALRARGAK